MNSGRYNDMRSWNKSSDCCSWGAVTCDAKSGQVISLNLNEVFLNNTLKPNNGLFKLQYLQNLYLFNCYLYGEIPSSVENLSHLTIPFLSFNNLSGKFSVSFANLTKLIVLDIRGNEFEPELLHDMRRFHNLEVLFLSGNSFSGPFPTSLFTIPLLQVVDLGGNNFTGPIDFANMSLSSRLQSLSLGDNKFNGPIPESISKFLNLVELDLRNSFIGPFPTSLFMIPSLHLVNLAGNKFKGPIDFGNTSTSSNLWALDLADNKLDGQIPESISKFLKLRELDLSNNKLEGKVPGCLLTLASLKLSHNSFSGFGKPSEVLDQPQRGEFRLDSNSFRGPFPHWICEIRSLELLDLSNNSFSGSITPCLRNITYFLKELNLRNNNFSGILPDVFVNATRLIALDVSRNRLVGKLPKTLINCISMELLNVEGNKFKDKFPAWLGSMPWLNVLILRSNQFYGPLYHNHESTWFQYLKVIDISHNDFSGTFPAFYFSNWFQMSQMTTLNPEDVVYMGYPIIIYSQMDTHGTWDIHGTSTYNSSMEMVHKSVDTEFEKIRKDFTTIDFSRNKFYGKIPESIGLLKGLRFLNLSSNAFTSNIPQSLANLTNLEALDLSQNQLSCQIPRDLGELSFLSTMNFANNNLEGPIPRGTQFQRQSCSSFMENSGLSNIEDVCGKPPIPNITPQELEETSEMINWIAAAITYGPGIFCGLVIGHIFISYKHKWFMERFRRNKPRVVIRSAR